MTRPLVFAAIAALASASLAAGATAPREARPAEPPMVFTRPLALPECIDLALRNNIPLRVARADLARAHGGDVGALAEVTPVPRRAGRPPPPPPAPVTCRRGRSSRPS